ncbi:thiamine pyrophosphate-dependent enzyme [Desulfovibrio sp. OttesenSCG-928-O18]|nr:thiamine pyrophosphate-dependent enzyme [Desulfovibrio sp. OttesenSCG-928-O18]
MHRQPALECPGLKQKDTVAHALAKGLQRHGVTHIFGQSLPSLLILAAEEAGITQVAYRQENAGGYMADAYARLTGRPGVITAQNGPAATLLVAPLAECMKASVPVVALLQEVARDQTDKNAFQEFDHPALFASCAKWVRRVTDPARAEDYLDMAFTIACSGRPGPAVLLLPADLLLEPAVASTRVANLGKYPLDRVMADPGRVEEAAAMLARAKRPLIIAGGGIHLSRACSELAALQDEFSLPVATTVMGKGAVDERHPLSLGVVGYFMGPNSATRHLRPMVTEADTILLIGSRTNQNGTDSWSLYPKNAQYIHLDMAGEEIGRNYEAFRLQGDAKLTLAALQGALRRHDTSTLKATRGEKEAMIAEGKARGRAENEAVRTSGETPIRPERIMEELNKRLTPESLVLSDASYSSIWIANYLTAQKPGMRFITPRGLAGLGWGLPYGMGAKVARPNAPVYTLVGDGGFAHVWAELETCVRMGLKLTCILINNGILGYQKHAEHVKFGQHSSAVTFAPVDHAAIARACGAQGIRVTDPEKLNEAFDMAEKAETMTLIEVMCTENAYPPVSVFTPDAQ